MERSSGKEDENPYKLLDLIPSDREYHGRTGHGGYSSDDKKLELRLGLPGEDEQPTDKNNGLNMVSVGNYFSAPAPWGYAKESSSQLCCTTMVDPPLPPATISAQKRAASSAVVGWPPIRSFRKKLVSSSSSNSAKVVPDPPTAKPNFEKPTGNFQKGLFVKINMDGIPIGRKVDLTAYDSYDKLCSAVDLLFRGLLAAQREGLCEKNITGLMDGSAEYVLVYEDNEGDRMLAGDVPWHMFVSNVKRLRVLKRSEVSTISRVRGKG
ncbi:hypothetical protein V2J09_011088 [Rumex salicifolius]